MARFEMQVLYAKVNVWTHDNYTETFSYVCFVKDQEDVSEIRSKVAEVINDEIQISEDEVLFGSADVELSNPLNHLVINFKNNDFKTEDVEKMMDLILTPEGTMH